jgi:hypothetical protein
MDRRPLQKHEHDCNHSQYADDLERSFVHDEKTNGKLVQI